MHDHCRKTFLKEYWSESGSIVKTKVINLCICFKMIIRSKTIDIDVAYHTDVIGHLISFDVTSRYSWNILVSVFFLFSF